MPRIGDNATSCVTSCITPSVGADSRVCPNTCPPTAGKHVDDTQIDTLAGQGRHGSLPLQRMPRGGLIILNSFSRFAW